jgi:predicted RNA-binding protein YlxR (DUF448 family)
MCIACRTRYPRHLLLRLAQKENKVVASNGKGRSFYLCEVCSKNEKKIKGLTKRFKQDEEYFIKLLKELIKNG